MQVILYEIPWVIQFQAKGNFIWVKNGFGWILNYSCNSNFSHISDLPTITSAPWKLYTQFCLTWRVCSRWLHGPDPTTETLFRIHTVHIMNTIDIYIRSCLQSLLWLPHTLQKHAGLDSSAKGPGGKNMLQAPIERPHFLPVMLYCPSVHTLWGMSSVCLYLCLVGNPALACCWQSSYKWTNPVS